MKRKWLLLLQNGKLNCHLCGLIILSRKHLTADHFPIPRSKGGKEVRPAHYWCDQAHGNRSVLYSNDLIRLKDKWKEHKVKFPPQVYESIKALKEK